MTLASTLRQQLNKSDPGGFHVSCDGWDVTLTADKSDSLSCALKELRLERGQPHAEALKPWAERIAQRVTGLMEPLRLLEVDGKLGKAVLRSQAPAAQDGKTFYYELVLERTARSVATLTRYAGDRHSGAARERVPFVLTHDAIIKLSADITGL